MDISFAAMETSHFSLLIVLTLLSKIFGLSALSVP